jgi:hypothetical protein
MARRDRDLYDHTPEEAPFAAPHVGWDIWWAISREMVWPASVRRVDRQRIAKQATEAVVERLKAWHIEKRQRDAAE